MLKFIISQTAGREYAGLDFKTSYVEVYRPTISCASWCTTYFKTSYVEVYHFQASASWFWSGDFKTSYKVVYSSLSTLTVNDFYRNLAAELGAQPAFRKTDNFKIIQDEINRLVLEKRQTPVIIIDEANYIGNAVLNDLKMLFNFEMDSKDRAVVLLSGLPQLNSTLRLSIHEPFRQRIVMNYNLEGMTKAEGHCYVAAKLNGAGCTQTVFEDNALEAILNAANGIPRMINKLCNASLLVGNSSNLNIITADAVMQAINDCELG